MKRISGLFMIMAVIISMTACSTTEYLHNVESERNTVGTSDDGSSYQIVENDVFSVYAESTPIENGQAAIAMFIRNYTDEALTVSEENIRIYGGSYESGSWDYLGHWSYSNFLRGISERASREQDRASGAGTIALLSWLLDDYYLYDTGYGFSVAAKSPSLLTAAAAISMLSASASAESAKSDLDYMAMNLMRTETIAPEGTYGGLIFIPVSSYMDYRMDITTAGITESLYFSRSR